MSQLGHQSSKIDLLFFSLERWDEVWRRNQFICAGLLEKHADLRILWVNPPVDALADRDWLTYLCRGAQNVAGMERFWTVDLVKPLPNIAGRLINEAFYLSKIKSALNELDFEKPLVWINDQNMAPLVRSLQLSPLVYDVTDDWISAAGLSARQRATVVRNDKWLVENAEHVVVCSNKLRELKSAARSLHLIPNGVDYKRYHPEQLAKLARPEELSGLKAPIIGYTGTLHEDRLDIELICTLAAEVAEAKFVFVGPNSLSRENTTLLSSIKNVKLLGARPYAELPAYMAAFDICMVPHKVNAFTDSLDPLKLYEYFACAKPVVSTRCAGFRDFSELVHLSGDAVEMASALRILLASGENKEASERRLSFAGENDWQKRIILIEFLLGLDREISAHPDAQAAV